MDEANKPLESFKKIITGRQLLSTEAKFRFICIATAVVHVIFLGAMHAIHVDFMSFYNIVVIGLYFYMGSVLVNREKYKEIIILFFAEIEIHSSLATVLLGMDFDFMLYTVALIPAAFYMTNSPTMRDKGIGYKYTITMSAFVVACYFIMSVVAANFTPWCDTSGHVGIKTGIRFFNIFIAFFIQFVFSLFFAMEASYMSILLEKENVKLGEEASYDPLTKLLNRRSLTTFVNEAIDTMERVDVFSIVMMDIDNFKSVNDTYGHDVGDTVLVELARIIMDEIRDGDHACRWGGEEFLLFAHGSKYDTCHAADRIRMRFAETEFKAKDDAVFHVTVTMGISEYRYGMQLRNIVEIADKRLYYGKTHGKNQVVTE